VIKKKDELTITIDDLTVDGHGIGKHEGMAVFVPQALPGETVKVSVIKQAKNYAVARVLQLMDTSPDRVAPPCPYYKRCGGCTLQHLSYEKQLEYKTRFVQNCLQRIGGLDISVAPCAPSPQTYGYRNKSSFPVAMTKDGVKTGFYAPHSHDLIDIGECIVADVHANAALKTIREYIASRNITPYDEFTGKGLLRHIILRTAKDGSLMAAAVINGTKMQGEAEWTEYLKENIEGLSSLIVNTNAEKTNVILGNKDRALYGDTYILDEILGLSFELSLQSFMQVNRAQSEELYKKALAFADIQSSDIVLDLFCGIGTLTLAAAIKAKKAFGVEIAQSAVDNANKNKTRNRITNAEFICGDCAKALPELLEKEKSIDIVLLDPPRKGCDKAVLDALIGAAPTKIVYVSCDPATLARDIKVLAEGGYRALEAAPFDMFPQTTHVECVIWMSRIE
jgi:23S rRNA (uracil1939-C5)-methyltransferase